MSTQYQISTQNNNKCPHGFPIGACPICSGMGTGVPKDKNKARKPGEMTYNECLAQWHRMQARDEAKLKASMDKIEVSNLLLLKDKILNNIEKLQKLILNFEKNNTHSPKIISKTLQIILNTVVRPILAITVKIINLAESLSHMINSATEKLSSLIGEIKNFIIDKVAKKIHKIIKTILSFLAENNEENEKKEDDKEVKFKKIKEIIKKFLRKRK